MRLAALGLLLCGAGAVARAGEGDAGWTPQGRSDGPARELADVDRAFFAAYELAVRESIASGPPALLVLGSEAILYEGGNRRSVPLLAPLFDELKSVAHVTLGLFAVLTLSDGAPLGDAHLAELTRFRAAIVGAQKAVAAAASFSPTQRDRQEQILAASLELADRTLGARRISSEDLTVFTRRMQPLVLDNVDEAVALYLDQLNRAVGELLAAIPSSRREQLVVLVTGVHQARIDNAAMQYFDRLLGNPPPIEQRVIYAENVQDEKGALHLLGIHVMARRVGKAFFDDPTYMNSDLFGRAAKRDVPRLSLPALAR